MLASCIYVVCPPKQPPGGTSRSHASIGKLYATATNHTMPFHSGRFADFSTSWEQSTMAVVYT